MLIITIFCNISFIFRLFNFVIKRVVFTLLRGAHGYYGGVSLIFG